jgi:hypothetical protein
MLANAATLSSSCFTLLAPITSDVILGSRSAHTNASWASDWPRRAAMPASARTLVRRSSVIDSARSAPPVAARESAGTPFR